MLTEQEWKRMEPALNQAISDVQQYRVQNKCSLADALEHAHGHTALELYRAITGFAETNINAIRHHRISLYGLPCQACGKPLRTPRASFCAACGAPA